MSTEKVTIDDLIQMVESVEADMPMGDDDYNPRAYDEKEKFDNQKYT